MAHPNFFSLYDAILISLHPLRLHPRHSHLDSYLKEVIQTLCLRLRLLPIYPPQKISPSPAHLGKKTNLLPSCKYHVDAPVPQATKRKGDQFSTQLLEKWDSQHQDTRS
jgi:hypothetical protein